ncbi:MAG: hypothetical protein FIB01_02490 [Gemmatimonadetes bacterium]|nr:hypothetical protein [Gemmatimonadota bacterium]
MHPVTPVRPRGLTILLAAGVLCAAALSLRHEPAPAASGLTRALWLYLDTTAARSEAPPALSAAALARRQQQGIAVLDGDRPIPPRLLARIRATGAALRVESRWLRAVSVDATPAQVRSLERLPFVRRIAPVGRLAVANGPRRSSLAAGVAPATRNAAPSAENDSAFYGSNYRAMAALGIPLVHDLGLTGLGISIAILDTGFERQHVALRQRILGGQYDFINGDTIVADEPGDTAGVSQEEHGTWVWSLLGGFNPGLIVGPAYNARFLLAKVDVEPGDTRADEDRWVHAAQWADSMGARIISSSVFFRTDFTDGQNIPFQQLNGHTTATTVAAVEAARRGVLVVQAVGNALRADGSLSAPADADSILAVGAVDLSGAPVDMGVLSSARGPTADARIKPEVVAVGDNLAAASWQTLVGLNYARSGTSFATAIMAGAAALFMEAWPDLKADGVRRALMLAGNRANNQNNLVGWGMPDLGAAIMLPEGLAAVSIVPRDVTGNPTSLAPVFTWTAPLIYPGLQPITFQLEFGLDSLFQQIVATDTVNNAFSLALRTPLRPGQRLWWRVRAEGRNGIRRLSDVGGPFRVLHWATLLTLAGDGPTVAQEVRPEFRWSSLSAPAPIGPLSYDVEVLEHGTGAVLDRVRNVSATSVRMNSPLTPNGSYRWRVIAHTQQGQIDTVTSVHPFVVNSSDQPPATILYQNFPNPFPNFDVGMTATRIWFDLSVTGIVELTVHDLRGRLVRRLIPAQESCPAKRLEPGVYGRPGSPEPESDCFKTTWDGRDQNGEKLPRGVYVLRLLVNGKPEYRRMLYQPN